MPAPKGWTPISGFWSKVQKGDDCWQWIASLNEWGYGIYGSGAHGPRMAHRFAWHITYGPIPNGKLVLHKCDNPRCVRPDHLFLGTVQDNNNDKARKGRSHRPRGELSGTAKLTPEIVFEIRSSDESGTELAKKYNTTRSAIQRARRGITWGHLPNNYKGPKTGRYKGVGG